MSLSKIVFMILLLSWQQIAAKKAKKREELPPPTSQGQIDFNTQMEGILKPEQDSVDLKKDRKENYKNMFTELGSDSEKFGASALEIMNGIKGDDNEQFLKGAIGLTLSIASITFEKFLPVISVLSLLWQKISSLSVKKTSMEEMVKKIIKEALAEAKEEELLAEINGLEERYDMLREILIEITDEDRKNQFISDGMINEVLQMAQTFGKFSQTMETMCKIKNEDVSKDKKVKRCLKLSNSLIELTISRNMLLMKGISAFKNNGHEGIAKVVKNFISNSELKAMEKYNFIRDPINIKGTMSTFVEFHAYWNQAKYRTLKEYMFQMNQKFGKKKGFLDTVIICNEQMLEGNCIQVPMQPTVDNPEVLEGKPKWKKFASMYIPYGLMVTLNLMHDYKGPYYGPCILPNLKRMSSSSDTALVQLTDHPDIDSHDMIIVADEEKFSKTARYMNYIEPIGIKFNLDGGRGSYWQRSIKSMIVPKGKQVTGYGSGKVYGPYIGFVKLEKVEGGNGWTDMLIEDYAGGDKLMLCTENDLAGRCEQLLISENPVKYEKDIWYPLNTKQGINFQAPLKPDGYEDWNKISINQVHSFEVPAGTSVKFKVNSYKRYDYTGPGYTYYDPTQYEIGPYSGPIKKNVPNTDSVNGDYATKEKIIEVMFVKTGD